MKFTTEQIQAEIDALEHTDFQALPQLGKVELRRRKVAGRKPSPIPLKDRNREAVRKYRAK